MVEQNDSRRYWTRWCEIISSSVDDMAQPNILGFNYELNALNPSESPNELNEAIRVLLSNARPTFLDILHTLMPSTRIFVSSLIFLFDYYV